MAVCEAETRPSRIVIRVTFRLCRGGFQPKIRFGMSEIKIGLPLPIVSCGELRYGLNSEKHLRDIMYFGEMFDVHQALACGAVDEISQEDPVARAKEIVAQWIDTVNRPFMSMKRLLKAAAAKAIRADLARLDWKESHPLANPVNDANDMAALLKRLGFEVTKLTNAGRREMQGAINTFGRRLKNGGTGLFYFAGQPYQRL